MPEVFNSTKNKKTSGLEVFKATANKSGVMSEEAKKYIADYKSQIRQLNELNRTLSAVDKGLGLKNTPFYEENLKNAGIEKISNIIPAKNYRDPEYTIDSSASDYIKYTKNADYKTAAEMGAASNPNINETLNWLKEYTKLRNSTTSGGEKARKALIEFEKKYGITVDNSSGTSTPIPKNKVQFYNDYKEYLENGGEEIINLASAGASDKYWIKESIGLGQTNHWGYMNKGELQMYNYLYSTKGEAEADKFLLTIQNALDKRAYEKETQEQLTKYENASTIEKVGMNAQSVAQNVFGGPMAFTQDVFDYLTTGQVRPYSDAHYHLNSAATTRQATAGDITKNIDNDVLKTLASTTYQALMSSADSLAGFLTFNKGYSFVMGMGAASSKMRELYESGATETEIIVGSLLAGAIEVITEKISLDKFVDNTKAISSFKDLIVKVLKQGGVEASEEVFSEIGNIAINSIIEGSAPDMKESISNIFWAAYGGFVSGGGMQAIGGIPNAIVGEIGAYKIADNIIKKGNGNNLIDIALTLPKDSKAYAQATKLSQKDSLSRTKIGELYLQTTKDITGEVSSNIKRSVQQKLSDAGIINAGELARIVTDMATMQEVSTKEQAKVYRNETARQIYTEITHSEGANQSEWLQNLSEQNKNLFQNMNLVNLTRIVEGGYLTKVKQVLNGEISELQLSANDDILSNSGTLNEAHKTNAGEQTVEQEEIGSTDNTGFYQELIENLPANKYNILTTKKPIQVTKQQWGAVNSARTQRYAGLTSEEIPIIDVINLGEYNTVNSNDYYFIRNASENEFSIIKHAKTLQRRKAIYDNTERENVNTGFDSRNAKEEPQRRNNTGNSYNRSTGEQRTTGENVGGIKELSKANGRIGSSQGPNNFGGINQNSQYNSDTESGNEERAPFREPSTKEIYRDSTSEEKYQAMLGERKDAKQRHITDIAKKLDSSLRLIWVDKNSDKLKGKNGKYVRATNTMYIARDVSVVEMYVEVFKHEFVHRLESRGSYKSFKDYLFKHSTAFEQYVRGQLGIINKGRFEGSREEALRALTEYYYNQFVNDTTIAKNLRDSFTMEAAGREIVADFAGDILFKGKENRADIAQALADENMLAISNTESSMDALEEIANTDRSLLQKIIDVIKDLITSLQGNPQTKRLVEDLEYIENRLARVYDSKDSKNAIKNAPGEQNKLINNQFPAFNESQSDANEWASRWAQSENVKTGDQKLASYHNRWYLIEKFDDVEFGYRIVERLNKKQFEELKGEIGNVRDTKGTSVEGASIRISSSIGRETKLTRRNYDVNSDSDKYSREDNKIQRVGAGESRFNRTKENYSISDRESSQLNSEESGDTEVQLEDEGQYSVGSPLQRSREASISKNKSQYDEFNSNVMQWACSASTKSGDMKIFNRRGKEFVLIEATEDGYIELSIGNYKELKEIESAYQESTNTVYVHTAMYENDKGGNIADNRNVENQGKYGQSSESIETERFQTDLSGNDEYLRSGDKGVNEPLDEEQYSVGSPLQQMRDNLSKYDSDEINDEEYYSENDRLWGEAIETYGSLPEGENAQANIAVPKAIAEDKPTERFIRTIIETGKLTEEMVDNVEAQILLGDFSYKAISDEAAMKRADTAVLNGNAEDRWAEAVNGDKMIGKNQIAIGERLLADAIESGDTFKVLEFSSELADIFTRAGQTVQAARLLKKMTGAGRLVSAQRTVKTLNKDLRQKYGEDRPDIKISEGAARRLANAKTEKGIENAYQELLQEVAEQMPVTFLDKWNAWRYFAMLSNPRTHVRNLVGNAIFLPTVRIKDFLASGIEKAFIREESKRTKSVIISKEYIDFAKNDGKNDTVKQLLKGNKYNDKSVLREKQRIFKNDALEFLTTFNSNALEAEDMLFKNRHYIHALAGFLQARNISLKNISQDILDEARIYAVNEARKATFNDVSALADAIQNFGNKNIGTSILVEGILPFKRTPINIVKRGIEYSPIGLLKTLSKGIYDLKKGKINATEYIDGIASGLTGTGIMLLGMLLANLGCISGGMEDDDESYFEKLLGKQEYAVEILGKSYTIDWAAPAVIPFMVGAEVINTINSGEEFNFSQLGNTVWNALEPITNLSMLSGIQSTIEATRYADNSQIFAAIIGDVVTTYSTQAIPSLFGGISRTIDGTQRKWYTDKNSKYLDSFSQSAINSLKSRIPGLSYTQIPKINAWGEEVSRGSVGERFLENFVSPGYYSQIDYDEAEKELKRIYRETGEKVFPKEAANNFVVDKQRKYLKPEEYVIFAKAKGRYSFDYVHEFIDSSAYKTLTDSQRANVIKNLYEYANAKAKTEVSEYDLMKQYKTVTNWERNGNSAINYYVAKEVYD